MAPITIKLTVDEETARCSLKYMYMHMKAYIQMAASLLVKDVHERTFVPQTVPASCVWICGTLCRYNQIKM